MNIRMKRGALTALVLLASILGLRAQDDFNRAYIIMNQRGDLDSAKFYIDRHMKLEASQKDGDSWYLYGFICKTIYTQREANNPQSPTRAEAYNAFVKSLALDTAADKVKANVDNLLSLGNRYYNDAVRTLDTIRYNVAIDCYNHFREAMVNYSKNFDIKVKDNEFYLALASTYTSLYNADRTHRKNFLELAKGAYQTVLKNDPNNLSANYNMGILYYNEAVNIYNNINWDDLGSVFTDQDSAVVIFKRSLPFMDKAYAMDGERYETVMALANVHKGLLEDSLSKSFETKAVKLRDQRYTEAVAEADNLFNAGKYAEAKDKYLKASYYKPDEQYAKDRVSECEKKIKGQ